MRFFLSLGLGVVAAPWVLTLLSFSGCGCGERILSFTGGTYVRDPQSTLGVISQETDYQIAVSNDLKTATETYVRSGKTYVTIYQVTEKPGQE